IPLGVGPYDFYGVACGAEIGNVYRLKEGEKSDKIRFSTTIGLRYAYGVGKVGNVEIPPFYDLIERIATGQEETVVYGESKAYAHEVTINIGGGLYF
ncbi:MAG: hypothetical protein MK135_06605, partial [Polyangiaceae bacterium]|nr:hypothetical protein [Polyangiaceae bacterium]